MVEMKELTADSQRDKLEFIENPMVAEFLGMSNTKMKKTMCYLQKEIQAVAQLLFYENQSGEN